MARSRELRVQIVGDSRDYGRAIDQADRKTGDLDDSVGRFKSTAKDAFKGAAVAAGAFAAAGLGASVKAAIDAEKSQARLDAQLKAVGSTLDTNSAKVQNVIQKHSRLAAIDDEDLQEAFGNLIRASGDVNKSLDLVGLTADIARGRHMEVADAATIVGKVAGGNVGILSRYGFAMKEGATATEALGLLQKRFSGQAEAYGKTTEGSAQRVRVSLENLGEKIGAHLLPHLAKAAGWLDKFIRQMQKGKGAGGTFRNILEEVVVSFQHFFKWVGNAIHNVDRFGDGTRRVLFSIARWFENTFKKAKQAVGNAIGFMLDRIADVVQAATHLPFVGKKFEDIAADIRKAADRARGLKKNIEAVPRELQVNVVLKAVTAGDIPKMKDPKDLFKGSGGPKLRRALGQMAANKWGPSLQKQADSLFAPGGPAGKAPGTLGKWEAMGHAMGLVTTSGYRPGDPGFHGSNRARDLSGSAATMLKYARLMYRTFGTSIDELIHTPLGVGVDAHRAGPLTSLYPASTLADHYDHVHIALRGGGRIPGSGSGDKVPALLEPGEHVFTKSEVKRAGGHDAMFSLRRALGGGTQAGGLGMAAGGKVGPGGIPRTDWRMVKSIASKYGVDPLLLVAIGKIETDWGRLGDGRNGNVLGVGSYDTGSSYQWAGLRNQLRKGSELLKSWGATTLDAVVGGKASSWATDPGWESAVASKYREIATPHWARNAQVVGDDDAGGGGTSGGISWTTKGGRVGKKTRLPEGTTFFKSGAGVRVNKGRIVARTEASAAGRERYRNRPTLGGTYTYESELAQADRILDRAGDIDPTNKRDVAAVGGKLLLLGNRKAAIKRRLKTIRKALKGRLSRSARSRLLSEQASLIGELGGIESTSRELHESMHPEAGEDTAAQAAEDQAAAQRELADQIKALKESIDEQNRITSSTVAIGLREAQRALADMISGEIGGLVGQRNRSPGDGMTAARY